MSELEELTNRVAALEAERNAFLSIMKQWPDQHRSLTTLLKALNERVEHLNTRLNGFEAWVSELARAAGPSSKP